MDTRELATGLKFPEGPVATDDGDVILVEIARGTLTKVAADGRLEVLANVGGGPNGAAWGPDGAIYITNNGGCFTFEEPIPGITVPGAVPPTWKGGSIQRVDLSTGSVSTLYTESSSGPLRAPNDLVFDGHGGFWFTDHGVRLDRSSDRTGIHYAKADGSSCQEVIFPLDAPNGIGLSPDGSRLYAAETHTGRVFAWDLAGPGEVASVGPVGHGGQLLAGLPGLQLLDSLAVDGEGWVCVGTLVNGGITAISPDGETVEHIGLPDPLVTNICFGGPDLRTAYATLSGTGALVSFEWPRPGLRLHHAR
ncbi:MAG: SMP-30/gluconolactonase/LRE family protein [Acidimicrobiales bacterium]